MINIDKYFYILIFLFFYINMRFNVIIENNPGAEFPGGLSSPRHIQAGDQRKFAGARPGAF
jgi:hypothetical protein